MPGARGKKIVAAIEDTRIAVNEYHLASAIVESVDILD